MNELNSVSVRTTFSGILFLLFFVFSLLPFLTACDDLFKSSKKNETTETPVPSQPADLKIGSSKTYDVPTTVNATVHDEITRLDFKFPDGGDGKLTVSRIISNTNGFIVVQDSAFLIAYTGTKRLQLVAKINSQSDDFLGRYTNFESNVCYDGGNLEGWLPEKASLALIGYQTFDLDLSTSFKAATGSWDKQPIFRLISYNKNTGWSEMRTTFRSQMNTYRETLKNFLPDARQQIFISDAVMNMPPDLFIEMQYTWFKGGPKYQPYFSYTGPVNRCLIVMDFKSSTKNLAHEWGHYVSHALIGDNYVSFAKNPRSNASTEHGVGIPGAKNNLIEEFAYLTEYLLTGSVGQKGSPESGTFCMEAFKTVGGNTIIVNNEPTKLDYPDLEGFGTTLFASLVRTSASITNYKGLTVNVPVVAPSLTDRKELFKICYEIVAQGTSNVIDVRKKMETAIQDKFGKTDLLPAMLQPLGWSYHIKGRFVDNAGKAIQGLNAQSYTVADGKEYLLSTKSSTSDSNGNFTLEEVYPGSSNLRVLYNGQTVNITDKVNIDWTKPTTEEINVGDIVVDAQSLLASLKKCKRIQVKFYGTMNTNCPDVKHDGISFSPSPQSLLVWSGLSFSTKYDYTDYTGIRYTGNIAGTVSDDGLTVKTVSAQQTKVEYGGTYSEGTEDISLVATNIPYYKASGLPPFYLLKGSTISQNITSVSFKYNYKMGFERNGINYNPLTMTTINYTDVKNIPEIGIGFFE